MISIEALPKIIDSTQLTSDLDGTLSYDHANWLETRLAVEEFAWQAADLLDRLDDLQVSFYFAFIFPPVINALNKNAFSFLSWI